MVFLHVFGNTIFFCVQCTCMKRVCCHMLGQGQQFFQSMFDIKLHTK